MSTSVAPTPVPPGWRIPARAAIARRSGAPLATRSSSAPLAPAAPSRSIDRLPAGDHNLILVGGVPGAGKTTAIARATAGRADVTAIDPEQVSRWLRSHLPPGVGYRAFRWLVHTLHTLRVLAALLRGPGSGRRLVVHDPGTRARRRRVFQTLARLAGWRTVLLFIDVNRSAAQEGQLRRGRVVRSFDDHWQRWQRMRSGLQLVDADRPQATNRHTPYREPVLLVDRADAAEVLERLCRPMADAA